MDVESTCGIKVNSQLANLLRMAALIIWDEAPMISRYAFEALDRTLRDVMQQDKVFGGKVFLLGGDFRQVLPVVPKGTRADIVNQTLCHSHIWSHTTVLRLTENMRVTNNAIDIIKRNFAQWVLDIGNGDVSNGSIAVHVALPGSMLLPENSLQALIDYIYGDLQTIQEHAQFFKDHGILAPRNKDVDIINNIALNKMSSSCMTYLSADLLCD